MRYSRAFLSPSYVVSLLTFLASQSYKFGWDFAAVTAVTMAAYSWFTIRTTSWRCFGHSHC